LKKPLVAKGKDRDAIKEEKGLLVFFVDQVGGAFFDLVGELGKPVHGKLIHVFPLRRELQELPTDGAQAAAMP
jgi:hypothetical protein